VDDAVRQALSVLRDATCAARLVLFDEVTLRVAERVADAGG
jgi:hypothetical protein